MKDAKGHGSDKRGTHSQGILNAAKTVAVAPKVLTHVLKNPAAGSITPNGKTPVNGYMVSVPGRTRMVSQADLADPSKGRAILQQYAQEHSDVLSKPGSHFGWWTDPKGRVHLDVSQNIKSRSRAVSTGVKGNQMSIWDVVKQREIPTGGTGG